MHYHQSSFGYTCIGLFKAAFSSLTWRLIKQSTKQKKCLAATLLKPYLFICADFKCRLVYPHLPCSFSFFLIFSVCVFGFFQQQYHVLFCRKVSGKKYQCNKTLKIYDVLIKVFKHLSRFRFSSSLQPDQGFRYMHAYIDLNFLRLCFYVFHICRSLVLFPAYTELVMSAELLLPLLIMFAVIGVNSVLLYSGIKWGLRANALKILASTCICIRIISFKYICVCCTIIFGTFCGINYHALLCVLHCKWGTCIWTCGL